MFWIRILYFRVRIVMIALEEGVKERMQIYQQVRAKVSLGDSWQDSETRSLKGSQSMRRKWRKNLRWKKLRSMVSNLVVSTRMKLILLSMWTLQRWRSAKISYIGRKHLKQKGSTRGLCTSSKSILAIFQSKPLKMQWMKSSPCWKMTLKMIIKENLPSTVF